MPNLFLNQRLFDFVTMYTALISLHDLTPRHQAFKKAWAPKENHFNNDDVENDVLLALEYFDSQTRNASAEGRILIVRHALDVIPKTHSDGTRRGFIDRLVDRTQFGNPQTKNFRVKNFETRILSTIESYREDHFKTMAQTPEFQQHFETIKSNAQS